MFMIVTILGCGDKGTEVPEYIVASGIIYGQIREAQSGIALKNVEVFVSFDGLLWKTATDDNGEYRKYFASMVAKKLLDPIVVVTVSPPGYETFNNRYYFNLGEEFRVDIELESVY
jgi:hypothetical protein